MVNRKFTVIICQEKVGTAEIEASCADDAYDEAVRLYNKEGQELPEMDDCGPLSFEVLREVE